MNRKNERKYAKLLILKEYIDMQLNLQNSYHEAARNNYNEIKKLADKYYGEHTISGIYYRKIKKQIREYDIMYSGEDIRKANNGYNRKSYLINKPHFSENSGI